jgi:cell division protein FtsI/penicillin-binding protein 2
MGAVRIKTVLFLSLGLFCPRTSLQAQSSAPHTLFDQAAVKVLEREFPKTGASFLLLDAKSGAVLAGNWENAESPIPLGSLVKPFTALAYASAHDFQYPKLACKGKASACWQDRPHGTLDLASAISVSCNAYFLLLAQSVPAERMGQIAHDFRIELPDGNFESQTLAGLGDRWRISPMRMAQAYLELERRKSQPGVNEILEGMRQSALRGTGMSVGHQLMHTKALVKTGTAPCTHTPWAPADGFALVLLPADAPEILLLVREHSVTGAKTAELAGKLLAEMEQ